MSRAPKRAPEPRASARDATGATSWLGTWNESRIAWIALAALIAVTLGRALVIGFVPDDIGILDAVSRGGPGRILAGTIPGLTPLSFVRDLGFWWWGTVLGLRASGFHGVALILVLVSVAGVADAAARLAGWRAALIAAAFLVLGPHAPTLIGWAPALPDALALAGASTALALLLRGKAWLAALATFVAVFARETLFGLPVAFFIAACVSAPARAESAENAGDSVTKPARPRLVRGVLGAGPSVLAAALAIGLRVWIGAWPGLTTPPAHPLRLIAPPGALQAIGGAFQAAPLLVIAAVIAILFVVHGRTRRAAPARGDGVDAGLGWALAIVIGLGLFTARRPWADVESMTMWAGLAIAFGMVLDRMHPWFARAFLVALALVQFGAHHATPLVTANDRPRPIVNLALLSRSGESVRRVNGLVASLCEPLRKTPVGFVAGVPPDPLLSALLGPVTRVSCGDTTLDLRLLGDFQPGDAWRAFLVVHLDPASGQVTSEPANAMIRARIGEGFLVHASPAVAAACFEAALSERPDDPELAFPLALALTAAGQDSAAREAWQSAHARGAAPSPDTLAARLLYGTEPARAAAAQATVTSAVRALTRDPSDSSAVRMLGRTLREAGAARSAAIAAVVAWGRTGSASDLVDYGEALEALEEPDLAREAYQRALASGLPREIYGRARERLAALGGAPGPTP